MLVWLTVTLALLAAASAGKPGLATIDGNIIFLLNTSKGDDLYAGEERNNAIRVEPGKPGIFTSLSTLTTNLAATDAAAASQARATLALTTDFSTANAARSSALETQSQLLSSLSTAQYASSTTFTSLFDATNTTLAQQSTSVVTQSTQIAAVQAAANAAQLQLALSLATTASRALNNENNIAELTGVTLPNTNTMIYTLFSTTQQQSTALSTQAVGLANQASAQITLSDRLSSLANSLTSTNTSLRNSVDANTIRLNELSNMQAVTSTRVSTLGSALESTATVTTALSTTQAGTVTQLNAQIGATNSTLTTLTASLASTAAMATAVSTAAIQQATCCTNNAAAITQAALSTSATSTGLSATSALVGQQSTSIFQLSSAVITLSTSNVALNTSNNALSTLLNTVMSLLNRRRDCSFFRYSPGGALTDGVYTIPGTSTPMFCDFTTGGGGLSWTLLTTMEQPGNQRIGNFPAANYTAWFNTANTMWIRGGGEARPLSPNALVDNAFHIRSQDWANILVPGRSYMLRQRFFRSTAAGVRTFELDVGYTFVYIGYLLQDQSTILAQRAFLLIGRTVYTDTTGINWDIPPESVLFWLPFSSVASSAPGFYTACGSFEANPSGCAAFTDGNARRFGNAGIIGTANNNNDPAGAWAPHMNNAAGQNFDIVVVHQAQNVYGTTVTTAPLNSQAIMLSYWIAPLG